MMTFGRLSGLVLDTGSDETDLGRWCWIKLGGGGKTTRIVTAYQPCDPGKDTAGETVWDQHQRYFEARGDGRSPRTIFFEDLTAQLLLWKAGGEEIILFADLNENVYTGRFAKRLAMDDIRMEEQCLKVNEQELPPTHVNGSRPIDAVFATNGIDCANACILHKFGGIGDHRVFFPR